MRAPQSGQIKLRIAEINLELVFITPASEAITFLLDYVAVSSPPNAQHRKRRAAGAFGRALDRGCGLSLWIQT
jgi:hypothetical protein